MRTCPFRPFWGLALLCLGSAAFAQNAPDEADPLIVHSLPPAHEPTTVETPHAAPSAVVSDSAGCKSCCKCETWLEAEGLAWWIKGARIPALITRGSVADALPGALGQPGTSVLFGDATLNEELVPGVRARIGWRWKEKFSVEISGFWLAEQSEEASFNASNFPTEVLARPFFDTALNQNGTFLFGFPGAFDGGVSASLDTRLFGGEANVGLPLYGNLRPFVGFRYVGLHEDLNVSGQYTVQANGLAFFNGAALAVGDQGTITDDIKVRNNFYGGQVGLVGRYCCGRFSVQGRGSLAVGSTVQQVDLAGSTVINGAAGVQTSPTGLLIQASNAGSYSRSTMSFMPEANVRVNYAVNSWLQVYGGYSVTYWSQVARAGDQLDLGLDTRAVPVSGNFTGVPGSRPILPSIVQDDFWMHGGTVGLAISF